MTDCTFDDIRRMNTSYIDSILIAKNKAETYTADEPSDLVEAIHSRYPFMIPHDWKTGEKLVYDDNRSWTELINLPIGWRKMLGIEICEDIRTVLLAIGGKRALETYKIDQIKEKFGSGRWYSHGPIDCSDADYKWISFVEETYCSIMGLVCVNCGKTDEVRLTTGWIVPVCKNENDAWINAREVSVPHYSDPFCIWYNSIDDEEGKSYKDMVVGEHSPVVERFGFDKPLHITDVWKRVTLPDDAT